MQVRPIYFSFVPAEIASRGRLEREIRNAERYIIALNGPVDAPLASICIQTIRNV